MKKKNKLEWEYNGEKYSVGNSLVEEWDKQFAESLDKLVYYNNNIFKLWKQNSRDRVCIQDIYSGNSLWTKRENVFQVIKYENI